MTDFMKLSAAALALGLVAAPLAAQEREHGDPPAREKHGERQGEERKRHRDANHEANHDANHDDNNGHNDQVENRRQGDGEWHRRGRGEEARIINQYFSTPEHHQAAGGYHDELTPELEAQIHPLHPLPAALANHRSPLPAELEHQLPALRSGRERVMVGQNVVILDRKTARVLDVIRVSHGR